MDLPFHPSAKTHAGEIRTQTQTAVRCRKENMGDLPSNYSNFGLDSFPLAFI